MRNSLRKTRRSVAGVLFAACAIGIAGCGGKTSGDSALGGSASDFGVTAEELAAYLAQKGVQEKTGERYDRVLRTFLERNALAEAIARESTANTDAMRASLKHSRNETLIKQYLDTYSDRAVTPATVQEFYDSHVSEYTKKRVRIARILIPVTPSMSAGEQQEKRELAKDIAEKVRGGFEFERAAKEYSQDIATSDKGGELGWITEDGIYGALAASALSLNAGDVSEPIETVSGLEIVKVLEGPTTDVTPLEKVRAEIEYKLKYESKLKEMDRLKGVGAARLQTTLKEAGLKEAEL